MNSASLRRTYLRSSRSRSTRYLMSFILKGWLQEEGQPSFDGCTPYSYLLKHKMWEMRFCRGGRKRIGSRNSGRCPGRGMRAQKGLLQAQPRASKALPSPLLSQCCGSAWKWHRLAFDRHIPSMGAGQRATGSPQLGISPHWSSHASSERLNARISYTPPWKTV